MSSDNGWIIRINDAGEYVLQMYFSSSDSFPDINDYAYTFKTLEEAVEEHNKLEAGDYYSEYGLTIDLSNKKETKMLDVVKYARKPFYVDAVQVTADNLDEVAKWCQGEVRSEEEAKYVHVRVHRPLNERQTKAFVGDWVLYAGTGYKVYTDKAFNNSFEAQAVLVEV